MAVVNVFVTVVTLAAYVAAGLAAGHLVLIVWDRWQAHRKAGRHA